MNISANQSQLLRQLNIKPLQARTAFFTEPVIQAESSTSDSARLLQPDDCLLSTDIKSILVQTIVSDWLLDPAASQCQLIDNESLLITPVLCALQQPILKQQLWALLQQKLIDDAD